MEEWKRNLLFLWISQAFSIIGFSFALPFVPLYLQELGVTGQEELRIWSGLFVAGSGIPLAIAAPVWGFLADRWGRKLMILRANLGGALTLLGMGLAPNLWALLAFRIMQGFFTGTVIANLTLVVSKTPKNRMGYAIGLMNSAVFAGNAVGPLMGGYFSDLFGFRASFFISSFFMLLSFLVALIGVRERFRPVRATASMPLLSRSKRFLLQKGILLIIGLIFLFGFSSFLLRPVYPLLVKEIAVSELGVATQTGIVNAAAGVAAVLAGIILGRLADSQKEARVYRTGAACAIIAGSLLIPQVFSANVWQLIPFRFGASFFAFGAYPILNTILARLVPPERRGAAFGLAGSARAVGMSVGSLLGGCTAAFFGFTAVFILGTGSFLLMALGLMLLGSMD